MNARSTRTAVRDGILPLLLAALLAACGGEAGADDGPAPADSTYPIEPGEPADGAALAPDSTGIEGMAGDAPGTPAPRPTGVADEGQGAGGPSAGPGSGAAARPAAERPAPSGTASPAVAEPASPPDAAGSQEVSDILRATSRRYESVRALQADFEQRLTNTLMGRTTESAGTLYQRQPDRFLMRFSQPSGDVIVSDGDYFWIYYPSADPKQVIRSSRGAGGLDLRSQFVGDPVQRFEATSQGQETVRGRATHVLTLTPREPMGYRRLKVWIDADDHLVRRFELTEENGNIRRFDLTDLRINPTLPDDLFRFEPPAGAVVVTR